MAVHHEKLMKFLRDHSTTLTIMEGMANTRSAIVWASVGKDPESIAGAFRFLADEINAGTFD